MSCKSAGRYDPETNRFSCKITGDECFYLFPNSKACAEDFGEGPDAETPMLAEEMNATNTIIGGIIVGGIATIPPCPWCHAEMVSTDDCIQCTKCGEEQSFSYAVCEEEKK